MDPRLICGQDVRRSGLWPTDESRMEAFIQRYGGTLEAGPVGDVAVMLRWSNENVTRCVTGVTARDALQKLRGQMHD